MGLMCQLGRITNYVIMTNDEGPWSLLQLLCDLSQFILRDSFPKSFQDHSVRQKLFITNDLFLVHCIHLMYEHADIQTVIT